MTPDRETTADTDPSDTPLPTPPIEVTDPHAALAPMPRGPDPDPLSELATIDDSGSGGEPDSPRLARQPGSKPGFGPDEFTPPQLEGNPELGIDPREAVIRAGDGK